RYSAIDARTTRHKGYALSIKHRKRIDLRRDNDPPDRCLILLTFGWATTVGGIAQTVYRGPERVRSRLILTMAANNLARLPRPLAA
ncbi:IS5/IS1182 family transposase, partial [Phaeovulum sp. NW3]|nr:IS5/IS1182 family transposase [Phaeovulum sp. NW3]